jgi:DNA-directed DNA polymerase III PolC
MRVRTGYSFKVAVGHLPEVIERIKEVGWTTAPISDRCSTYSFRLWDEMAKKAGLRPIFGVELGVVERLGDKRPSPDYWAFFAKDALRPLNELINKATANAREPLLTYRQALEADGLIKISGDSTRVDLIDGMPSDFAVGISPATPRAIVTIAVAKGLPLIATSSNYFTRAVDKEFYRVALGKNSSSRTYPQHVLSDEEWMAACQHLAGRERLTEALGNRDAAEAMCLAELGKATLLTPAKPKTLRQMCLDGGVKLNCDLTRTVYRERLDKELRLIAEKDFEDYFYIIAELMAWSRERMIVGPARGSSCGSLVCYLLGITAVDPIPFDLVFERFIDVNRTDLPDIDLDFSDAKRHLVFEHMEALYGRERVARLGSISTYQAKSILNQAGYSLRVPQWQLDEVSTAVIKRSMGDSRAGSTMADTFTSTDVGRRLISEYPEMTMAARMEDHPSNAGQHAAGMILTQEPVTDIVAVDARTGSAMCDKYDSETLNLLKIDMLGLTQLSVFERCLELMGEKPRSEFLEKLPLDDQAAFDVLNKRHLAGVFQFTPSTASAHLVDDLLRRGAKINHIEDLVSLTAVVRPGPLGSGVAETWLKRRSNQEKVSVPHQLIEPYVSDTLGLVIYQEQVLRIGRELGDLSWGEVTALRKAMSKSLGKEYFDQFGDKWKAGAVAHGLPEDVAFKTWDDLCTYGMWAFNRSHSVAYGLVSYWCCWLKAHHPVEYAAAMLDAEKSPEGQIMMLRELRDEGIEYKAVDPDHSTDRWEIVVDGNKRTLVGPLTNIKGIGPATVMEILDARRRGVPIAKPAMLAKLRKAATAVDSLFPVAEAIAKIDLLAQRIETRPTPIADVQPEPGWPQVVIIGRVRRIAPLNENEPSRVAKRKGKKVPEPADALNMFLEDDGGEIFCKIHYKQFPVLGRKLLEKLISGKSILAVKGSVPPDFRMIWVKQVRVIGEM